MTEIYALSLFQGNKLSSYRNLTFEIVLQNKQNSFHAVVIPNSRDQRQRKQKRNNETDTTNYHVPAVKE